MERAYRRLHTLLAATTVLLWQLGTSQTSSSFAQEDPRKLALLIGINDYKYDSIPDLRGAVNDVTNMKRLLIESFGFPDDDEHVRVLTDAAATRTAILQSIEEHLIDKADRDTIVVFHYSGHGSKIKDSSGDETDGLDETLVPYDSGRGVDPNEDILDDELNALMATLTSKTENVTFIFDSCHSGSATRGSGKSRTVATDPRPPPRRQHFFRTHTRAAAEGRTDLRSEGSGYALISGARAQEEARELKVGDMSYGALTYFLAREIRAAQDGVTYRDIMDNVKAKVTARYPGQHPQLEGSGADNLVFSARSRKVTPYVLASPGPGGSVKLNTGHVHGATVGSIYDVFPPGTRVFDGSSPAVARVVVQSVDVAASRARVTNGQVLHPSSRAIEREHKFPDAQVRVHIRNPGSSPILGQIEAKLTEFKHMVFVDEASGYDLLIAQFGDHIATEGAEPGELSPRVAVSEPDVVDQVVGQVTRWAGWLAVLSIENQDSKINLEFEIETAPDGRRGTRFAERDIDLTLEPGQRFTIRVRNTSKHKLYLALLDLSSDGSVVLIFPYSGAQEYIAPGKTWRLELETWLPPPRESIRDVLKLFATTTPCDFRFLQRQAVRGGPPLAENAGRPRNALEELLANAALGTTRGDRPIKVEAWASAERVLEVRR